jgi:hypothetical protein
MTCGVNDGGTGFQFFPAGRDPFSAAEKAEKSRILGKLTGRADAWVRNRAVFRVEKGSESANLPKKAPENVPFVLRLLGLLA